MAEKPADYLNEACDAFMLGGGLILIGIAMLILAPILAVLVLAGRACDAVIRLVSGGGHHG